MKGQDLCLEVVDEEEEEEKKEEEEKEEEGIIWKLPGIEAT
jgi:hypothetical protein